MEDKCGKFEILVKKQINDLSKSEKEKKKL